MERKNNVLWESLSRVAVFFVSCIVVFILLVVSLFQLKFGYKKYDIMLDYRFSPGISFGVQYVSSLELWKINKEQDGSLSIRRIYPF
ncbi:MAG: hypothetical protein PHO30_03265 [Candidatus Omnitrophica bacterium]|nr:hypothetical protein [Candidatus Omnitrophota bacterium]